MKKLAISALAGAGTLAMVQTAQAAPLTGGETVVEVTAGDLLASNGVTLGLVGTASLADDDPLTVSFPITGGDLDGIVGTIEHAGSGVSLTAGTTVVELTDFLIDTTTAELSGTVTVGATVLTDVPLFDLDLASAGDVTDIDNPSIPLLVMADAAVLLEDTFMVVGLADLLSGAQFGLAATAPLTDSVDAVPLPGAAVLFLTGAAGFAARRRMKA